MCKRRNVAVLAIAFSTLFTTACGSKQENSSSETEGWGDILIGGLAAAQLTNMSPKSEMDLGAQTDAALKDPRRKSETGLTITVSSDSELTSFVNNVGQKLALQAKRKDIRYTFQVVNSSEVNAFATTGGYVYVNSGLIRAAKTEGQLAGVIAHEIAHIANKHTLKAMAQSALIGGLISGSGLNKPTGALVKAAVSAGVMLPRSRDAEFEADKDGFSNMRATGYAAVEMKGFFKVLIDLYGDKSAGILSTHPATSDRIARLKSMETEADKLGAGRDESAYAPIAARAR